MKKIWLMLAVASMLTAQKTAWYDTIDQDIWTKKNEYLINHQRKNVCNKILRSFLINFSYGPFANKILVKKLLKRTSKKCGLTRYKISDGSGQYGYVAHSKKALRNKKCFECMQDLLIYVRCAENYYESLNTVDVDAVEDSEPTEPCTDSYVQTTDAGEGD